MVYKLSSARFHYTTRGTFHNKLYEGRPDPDNPAIAIPGERIATDLDVARQLATWLKEVCGKDRPTFVSDNVAYDWQWIAALFDRAHIENPFGHSGRRISDYYAGLTGKWGNTQAWKRLRPLLMATCRAFCCSRLVQPMRARPTHQ
jgi:hypothetical protein